MPWQCSMELGHVPIAHTMTLLLADQLLICLSGDHSWHGNPTLTLSCLTDWVVVTRLWVLISLCLSHFVHHTVCDIMLVVENQPTEFETQEPLPLHLGTSDRCQQDSLVTGSTVTAGVVCWSPGWTKCVYNERMTCTVLLTTNTSWLTLRVLLLDRSVNWRLGAFVHWGFNDVMSDQDCWVNSTSLLRTNTNFRLPTVLSFIYWVVSTDSTHAGKKYIGAWFY